MTVDDIMVPRSEIIGIDINDDWKSILRQLSHSPHGRIVLYRDSLDDAIGMLRVREAATHVGERVHQRNHATRRRGTGSILSRRVRRSAHSW